MEIRDRTVTKQKIRRSLPTQWLLARERPCGNERALSIERSCFAASGHALTNGHCSHQREWSYQRTHAVERPRGISTTTPAVAYTQCLSSSISCKVCFVGDGINDSIMLKNTNVSISLRGASSIAIDTAHIVFLEEGLAKLCELRDIARDLDHNVKRSWSMILAPNIACIAGVFTMGFGIMASVVTNNVAALAALANGVLPLRKVAQIEAERRHRLEMSPKSHATERNALPVPSEAAASTSQSSTAINDEFTRRRHQIPVATEFHWHRDKLAVHNPLAMGVTYRQFYP